MPVCSQYLELNSTCVLDITSINLCFFLSLINLFENKKSSQVRHSRFCDDKVDFFHILFKILLQLILTRMHSSRMCTACALNVSPSMLLGAVCSWGVCSWGVSALGECLVPLPWMPPCHVCPPPAMHTPPATHVSPATHVPP